MDSWIRLSLLTMALMLAVDGRVSVAQSRMAGPPDHATVVTGPATQPTPPPIPSSAPRIVSRLRFEPRPDISQVPGRVPTGRAGSIGSFGVVTLWPWEVLTYTQVIPSVPVVPLAQSSPGDLVGGVQLDVQPWRAEVYVDGAYAGIVNDFTGYYRPLELIPGPHTLTIVANDFDPLFVDVVVIPGRTITYRGTLTRASGR
jgi:hypothetical protein